MISLEAGLSCPHWQAEPVTAGHGARATVPLSRRLAGAQRLAGQGLIISGQWHRDSVSVIAASTRRAAGPPVTVMVQVAVANGPRSARPG